MKGDVLADIDRVLDAQDPLTLDVIVETLFSGHLIPGELDLDPAGVVDHWIKFGDVLPSGQRFDQWSYHANETEIRACPACDYDLDPPDRTEWRVEPQWNVRPAPTSWDSDRPIASYFNAHEAPFRAEYLDGLTGRPHPTRQPLDDDGDWAAAQAAYALGADLADQINWQP